MLKIRINADKSVVLYYEKKKRKGQHIASKYPPNHLVSDMLLNGSRHICERGYEYIEHKGFKCYTHRLVVLNNDIVIPKGHSVHHIDHNKLNNSIDNLEVLSWQEHMKRHHKKR
jgi:hypothetical protein